MNDPSSSSDPAADMDRFYAALRNLSLADWNRILSEWNSLKRGAAPWGTALKAAEASAVDRHTDYASHDVEERVFQELHERLREVLHRREPEEAAIIELELLKATTVAAKALSLRGLLEPSVFSLLYLPFIRSIPVRGATAGGGCLLALVQLRS